MKRLILLLLLSFNLGAQNYYYAIDSDTGSTPPPAAFDSSYQAVLDRATFLGYSLPSDSMQIRGNQLVVSLKDSMEWDNRDVLYVFCTDADSNFAKINWKDPDTLQAVLGGTVDFIPLQGYQGIGSAARILTGYQPSLFLGAFTLNDANFSAWLYDLGTGSNYILGDFARNLIRQDGLLRITSAVSATAVPSTGYLGLSRSSSTQCFRNYNGTITPFTQNSASVDDNPFTLLNRHGQNVGSNCIMGIFSAGGHVSGNAVYNIFNAYMSGL